MKKLTLATLALCLMAIPAQAGGGRTESGEYNTVVVEPQNGSPSAKGQITNGVTFSPRKGERHISVVVEDQSGLPARAVVGQDIDGDGVTEWIGELCGATESPIRFRKGYDVTVAAQEGPCANNTVGMATFGTITATFTK